MGTFSGSLDWIPHPHFASCFHINNIKCVNWPSLYIYIYIFTSLFSSLFYFTFLYYFLGVKPDFQMLPTSLQESSTISPFVPPIPLCISLARNWRGGGGSVLCFFSLLWMNGIISLNLCADCAFYKLPVIIFILVLYT